MHGKGIYVWPDTQQCYTGQWADGKRHGDGRHHFSSRSADPEAGDFYDGEWKEGVMHGKGRYVDAGGEEHEGVWVEGVCPEVDFSHVPESGSFRYRFSVRTASLKACRGANGNPTPRSCRLRAPFVCLKGAVANAPTMRRWLASYA